MLLFRQELNRRGAFDFKEGDVVNYRSMLKRLMVELVNDEEKLAAEKARVNQENIETEIERSKRIREEKKREALERSKQRQASDPNYFAKRAEANLNATTKTQPNSSSNSNSNSNGSTIEDLSSSNENESENEVEIETITQNPFETFPKKTRSKIYVK